MCLAAYMQPEQWFMCLSHPCHMVKGSKVPYGLLAAPREPRTLTNISSDVISLLRNKECLRISKIPPLAALLPSVKKISVAVVVILFYVLHPDMVCGYCRQARKHTEATVSKQKTHMQCPYPKH